MPVVKNIRGEEIMQVSNLDELGDLSARTDISDGTSNVFLKATALGELHVTDTGTAASKKTFSNGVDPSEAIPGGGAVDKSFSVMGGCDAVTGALANINPIRVDGNGVQYVSQISTQNVAPANNTNSGITDDPANSVAVGLRARTGITAANTETFLLCDADGHLQVDVANQNAAITGFNLETTQSALNAKISKGKGIVTDSGGMQQVLLYGKNGASGDLEPLETLTDRLVVKNLELGATGPTTVSSLARMGIYGQVETSGNYKTVRLTTDGRLETKTVNTDHDTNQYADQAIAGDSAWSTIIETTGYNKLSIVINSAATSNVVLSASSTSGGVYLPFKEIFINSTDTGAGTHNIGFAELQSPPKFIKINNADAGGIVLQILTTAST